MRRVWAPKGKRPQVPVQPRYQWLYLYGFVRPSDGQTSWLIIPAVNITAFTIALAEFAREVGAGQGKQVVLVLDQAGWHVSEKVKVPEGVHLHFLPAASPELQPAERLWPLANEAVANRHFAGLKDLEDALALRCVTLQDSPQMVRGYTSFHWWPVVN